MKNEETLRLRLPDDLKETLAKQAEEQGRSLSNLVRLILVNHLKTLEAQNAK